jgi:hypothetical protein
MGGLHFRPTASIDDPKASHSAAIIVGFANLTTEVGVADLAVHQHLFDASDLVEPRHDIEFERLSRLLAAALDAARAREEARRAVSARLKKRLARLAERGRVVSATSSQ